MHCKDDPDSWYINPWIFHPAAFIYVPGFLGGFVLVFGGLAVANRND